MIEKHPFGDFVPKNARYLILGSFTGKITDNSYDWFYGTKRNQFWPIMQEVYKIPLTNKEEKQSLFKGLNVAITDIILSCERKSNNNLDTNLINIVLNKEVAKILKMNMIKKIFFSSRFVEKLFKRYFKDLILEYPDVELITLPSPSPRYAAMRRTEKIEKYRQLLPELLKEIRGT